MVSIGLDLWQQVSVRCSMNFICFFLNNMLKIACFSQRFKVCVCVEFDLWKINPPVVFTGTISPDLPYIVSKNRTVDVQTGNVYVLSSWLRSVHLTWPYVSDIDFLLWYCDSCRSLWDGSESGCGCEQEPTISFPCSAWRHPQPHCTVCNMENTFYILLMSTVFSAWFLL